MLAGRLLKLHGARACDVLAEAGDDPFLKESLVSSPTVEAGLMGCEVFHAFRNEMAQELADVLLRRTTAAYGINNIALDVDGAAEVAAKHLGRSEEHTGEEVEDYHRFARRYTPKAMREEAGVPGAEGSRRDLRAATGTGSRGSRWSTTSSRAPGTGRDRNNPGDSGDAMALSRELRVDTVPSGHRHVPYVWSVSGVRIVHSGTVSTFRIRGVMPPSYKVQVDLRQPGGTRTSSASSATTSRRRRPVREGGRRWPGT